MKGCAGSYGIEGGYYWHYPDCPNHSDNKKLPKPHKHIWKTTGEVTWVKGHAKQLKKPKIVYQCINKKCTDYKIGNRILK